MPLITPEELIILLDLPANTQPTDRAQLACDLVVDAVTRVAGAVLTVPYPAGVKGIALSAAGRLYDNPTSLRSATVGGTAQAYAGDVLAVLTGGERDELGRIFGTSPAAPVGSFPATMAWPDPIPSFCYPS